MSDFAEQMEQAAHSGHDHHESSNTLRMRVGITIALLGVLLAISSALVGGQRTELIATMVEQTNTSMKYQTLSTKYRVLLAQLRQLHSLTPDEALFSSWEGQSQKLRGELSSGDLAKLARIIRLENAKNLNAEIPTRADLVSFATVIRAVDKEQEAAHEWSESYEGAIAAHSHGAEHYEWGQLASEIGIVMASIALLLMSHRAWHVSLLLSLVTVGVLGVTHFSVRSQLRAADAKISQSRQHFESMNGEKQGRLDDEALLEEVEKSKPPVIDPK